MIAPLHCTEQGRREVQYIGGANSTRWPPPPTQDPEFWKNDRIKLNNQITLDFIHPLFQVLFDDFHSFL